MIKEKKQVAIISVFASGFLVLFKLIVGITTGSLSILTEALDSGIDLIASFITFFAVRISDSPADEKHNYGHGKVENLSAFLETFLLVFSGLWIIYHAITNIVTGDVQIDINIWSFIVIIVSIIVDFSRVRKMKKVAKKTNSQALEADAANFTADMISCFFVLIGLVFSYFGYHIADSIAAIIVSFIILRIAFKMGKKSISVLLDVSPKEHLDIVRKFLKEQTIHYHSLKIRTSGADTFISFHIHLDPDMILLNTHDICDDLEKNIKKLIPRSEVNIHVEPNSKTHIETEKEIIL